MTGWWTGVPLAGLGRECARRLPRGPAQLRQVASEGGQQLAHSPQQAQDIRPVLAHSAPYRVLDLEQRTLWGSADRPFKGRTLIDVMARDGGRQRRLNHLKRSRLSCGLMIWLHAHPLSPSSVRQQVASL